MQVLRVLLFLSGLWLVSVGQCQEPVQVYAGITYGLQHIHEEQPAGRATDAVKMLLDATGQPYEILMMNWAQAQRQCQDNGNSLIYAIARTPEREAHYKWLIPIARLQLQIARLSSRPELSINRFEQLKHYKVAAVRALSTHHMLKEAGFLESEQLLLVDSSSRLLKMITAQLVDFVFYEPSITPQILAHYGYQQDLLTVTDIPVPVPNPVLYLAANPAIRADISERIVETHQQLLLNEQYQALLRQVLPDSQKRHF
ncbi:type 2 periplasmic-binding domain-containing protein [Planctobacterium marinum]|uniref:transporter substrate-binding domain-containing protein n=1 Tax=Planctobacterium marinum TaxID=1631968 RepID=UPI001E358B55|nr:transporter substrate-binding domain-containing protein [Planctobacterium marinum]MCC2607247.1 transporter substrate-binding domain-containing protein [Planctobacterium marinum]